MAEIAELLGAAVDPSWSSGEPSELLPNWSDSIAELRAISESVSDETIRFARALAGARDRDALQAVRNRALSREHGAYSAALTQVPGLPLEQKRLVGRALNLAKRLLEELEKAQGERLDRVAESIEAIDVTLPGRRSWTGRTHVLAQVRDELLDLFHGLGFTVYTSPEVELDEYNFAKLNFPPDHPARDAQDTYLLGGGRVLRTHTSPGWVRAMEEIEPPLRLVFPGRVYRAEAIDASHMDQFHQMDGLCVDRDISMADLKSTLNTFARAIYRADVPTRIVPIYFPFVEPGVQMDIQCASCTGTGRIKDANGDQRCPVCKGGKWVEVLGAGMVHPNVFRAVGIDPEEFTGFAFGMGLERIAMGRHHVSEIRSFLENDLRFLHQF
ncbi:MAG: phenylalanine--tRNA ligase subunit alpha [Candidatus Eisenbacteria bacterium]|uniref:Phenylalanine--tRNA ligase alpha subunit n=1 Tax=Eiseniibacteriota bacterium TaxID=2212470 RepID=A0A849SR97_UNCEI|nr:phenylalanine--tRNA ligase subunit alpha [Candidatus Eisenbacteria bacterium]